VVSDELKRPKMNNYVPDVYEYADPQSVVVVVFALLA